MNQSMIKIIDVTKNRKKFIVSTLNKDYTFEEDTIIKYAIYKNKEFTEKEFENIVIDNQKYIILNVALYYLSFRSRSIYEVYSYLRKKDYSEDLVLVVIEKLKDLEYLDDFSFSKELLDYYIRNNKGPKFILEKLKQKGIESFIINEIMLLFDNETETKIIHTIIEKNIKKNIHEPIKKQKQKLYNKLLRDGFSSNRILSIINQYKFIADCEQTLIKEIEIIKKRYSKYDEKIMKNKIITSLLNKGYDYAIIKKYL
ncbi:MAG: RecX family transcriptional regulator [Bacilli bacterium]|nr:RecX family transcriptional regulator [Bacilli bacterium]MDD2681686.1 RecX family transcriptional regulator [Bacilli bacterium]MDD3121563.1 RecX family transcriptional regulator [Bacilli bacterium]MDD5182890.1 RecX family transcriptional regulator [Bacilli bacterium]MDY0363376.1 RecX family transcriptional regulator [Bacilli bacterium]